MKNHTCPEKGNNIASSSANITHLGQQQDSDKKYEIELPSRHHFPPTAGRLIAATLLAAIVVAMSSLTDTTSMRAEAQQPSGTISSNNTQCIYPSEPSELEEPYQTSIQPLSNVRYGDYGGGFSIDFGYGLLSRMSDFLASQIVNKSVTATATNSNPQYITSGNSTVVQSGPCTVRQ
jgi:hypothetical protein